MGGMGDDGRQDAPGCKHKPTEDKPHHERLGHPLREEVKGRECGGLGDDGDDGPPPRRPRPDEGRQDPAAKEELLADCRHHGEGQHSGPGWAALDQVDNLVGELPGLGRNLAPPCGERHGGADDEQPAAEECGPGECGPRSRP